jgi:hypothetical protein
MDSVAMTTESYSDSINYEDAASAFMGGHEGAHGENNLVDREFDDFDFKMENPAWRKWWEGRDQIIRVRKWALKGLEPALSLVFHDCMGVAAKALGRARNDKVLFWHKLINILSERKSDAAKCASILEVTKPEFFRRYGKSDAMLNDWRVTEREIWERWTRNAGLYEATVMAFNQIIADIDRREPKIKTPRKGPTHRAVTSAAAPLVTHTRPWRDRINIPKEAPLPSASTRSNDSKPKLRSVTDQSADAVIDRAKAAARTKRAQKQPRSAAFSRKSV